jgi:hypothetical protein
VKFTALGSFVYSAGPALSKPPPPTGFVVRSSRGSRGAAVGLQSSFVAQFAMWWVGWEISRGCIEAPMRTSCK